MLARIVEVQLGRVSGLGLVEAFYYVIRNWPLCGSYIKSCQIMTLLPVFPPSIPRLGTHCLTVPPLPLLPPPNPRLLRPFSLLCGAENAMARGNGGSGGAAAMPLFPTLSGACGSSGAGMLEWEHVGPRARVGGQ